MINKTDIVIEWNGKLELFDAKTGIIKCVDKNYDYFALGLKFYEVAKEKELDEDAQEWQKALYCFNTAVELNPKNIDAYIKRGNCYLNLGNQNDAWYDFIEAKKLKNEITDEELNDPDIDLKLVPFYSTKIIAELSDLPKHKASYLFLAANQFTTYKNYNEAKKCVEEAFNVYPVYYDEQSYQVLEELKKSFLNSIDCNKESNIRSENIIQKTNKELKEIKEQLKSENQEKGLLIKEKESLQNRMQKLVEQFTHSLGNIIFPDTIYQVAERIKNIPECRQDTLLLHEAYHSEIIIKLQAELLRQRYTNTNPEKFRLLIRTCRRTQNTSDKTKTIEDILNYAISRVVARFLNQHYAKLESIRNKILNQNNVELNQLKQKFEDDILLNKISAIEWVSQNLRPIKIIQISSLWQKIFILADSYTEALLFGYFSEILFNAFKYADHDNAEFLSLSFAEQQINDTVYLVSTWTNQTTNQKQELGTNKGLEAIAEDLKQLNDTDQAEQNLLINQQDHQFQISLFFKKDLLIDDIPILTRKRKITENSHA